ncbi:hypothetical protein IV203_007941 [Nitzschia inconspicua]|uniref:Uncharacterized protein n=1 Tax=Nitzschia inconspicua TaxID=303405 RepID=A0A9K3KXY1_9STRA|nr:hypothetical protein IV203_007941 [Nitzschia inconspicua]
MTRMMRGRRGSRSLGKAYDKNIASSPWMAAIQNSTIGVLSNDNQIMINNQGNVEWQQSRWKGVVLPGTTTTTVEEVDHSLEYLIRLEIMLQQGEKDCPPVASPPYFKPFRKDLSPPTTPNRRRGCVSNGSPSSSTTSTPTRTDMHCHWERTVSPPSPSTSNRFGVFAIGDNEKDHEKKKEASNLHFKEEEDEEDDARDKLVHCLSPRAKPFVPQELDTLRLLIRLYASQADLYARKARLLSCDHQWMAGAGALQSAIYALQGGVELADAEIAKYMMQDVLSSYSLSYTSAKSSDKSRRRFDLETDADIIHVSVQSLSNERTRYLAMAKRHLDRIKKLLVPTYANRSRVKQNMGELWYSNPNPRNSYWEMQKKMEEELFVLQQTIETLVATTDTTELATAAQYLKKKIQETWNQKNRYNGQRCAFNKNRLKGYTNPENEGWIHTGSVNGMVEFFEKHVVEEVPPGSKNLEARVFRIDWHFTTGMVRLELEENGNKSKQKMLLEKRVTAESFLLLLQNPKTAHAIVRNHKEPHRIVSRQGCSRWNGYKRDPNLKKN